ncbi:MAG: ABC transporter permease, partial [Eubacteriales bacterium]
ATVGMPLGSVCVLGMGKKNIAAVMLCENIIVDILSIGGGLALGILLSKLVQGVLYHMLGQSAAPLDFGVNIYGLTVTAIVFLAIFTLIYLDSVRQVAFSDTIELLHSSNQGEREPKANYLTAILGVIFLGGGYVISQIVDDAGAAIGLFFIAVILVIIGTYALFISGSVALAKTLKKNKRYYYTPSHFISVSGMTYRMKRNGAGLASICILSTMVLVMISSTVCMYMGVGATTRMRYRMDITTHLGLNYSDSGEIELFREKMYESANQLGFTVTEEAEYYTWSIYTVNHGGDSFTIDKTNEVSSNEIPIELDFLSVSDYNKYNHYGEKVTLADDEVLILTYDCEYNYDTITLNGKTYRVNEKKDLVGSFDLMSNIFNYSSYPHIVMFFPCELVDTVVAFNDIDSPEEAVMSYYIGWNITPNDIENSIDLTTAIDNIWYDGNTGEGVDWNIHSMYSKSYAEDYSWTIAMYGGLFFIAVILGLVFIAGAVLIMYYKQVTEGYEDAERYEIMQKVGMTDREIKKSINSQVLTVFFAPLIAAGIHTAFAYNMIKIILKVFLASSGNIFLISTIVCYAVFAVFYIAVYLITSKAYYRTVSHGKTAMLN